MDTSSSRKTEFTTERSLGSADWLRLVKNKPDNTYFGGRLLSFRRSGGITLAEVEYHSARTCPRHGHGDAFFALLLRGSYAEKSGGSTLRYYPFTLGFHSSDTTHTDEVNASDTRFLIIQLSITWFQHLRESEMYRESRPRICNAYGSWLATLLYDQLESRGSLCPLSVENLVFELLSTLVEVDSFGGRPHWLDRASELLRSEFPSRVTVARLATELGLHPIHLSRQFRRYCRQSIAGFVHSLRVSSAILQLRDLDVPVSEVALASGYSDQSQFTKAFKRQMGITPGAFRKRVSRSS
jgi:AraC-like DNA-binding protein